MRKSSTYLILIILIGVAAVVANRYHHYLSERDFLLDISVPCDPASEQCFVSDCTPDEPGCDTSPYKHIEIAAKNAPACLEEHACDAFTCDPNDSSCSVTYCSADTVNEGEACTPTPENPIGTTTEHESGAK